MRKHVRQWCVPIAIFLAAAGGTVRRADAETRALLVGSWSFHSKQIPDLKGPPNDLNAMESLMRAQGATDVTVLGTDSVSRTTIETALHALGLRAKPGDWIVFYYSGHGAAAEAAVKGTADGDRDQFIPLPGFDVAAPDPEHYVVDKDFYAWMARYIPRNVEVLMIADVCHSGTLNRSIDPRAWAFTPRLAFRGDGNLIKLAARPAPRYPNVLNAADVQAAVRPDLPNEIYLGAAQDDQLALEAALPVEGAPSRGLLTYSFEQALTTYGSDGQTLAADFNHDGVLTVGELATYLDTQIRELTGNRQESSARFVTGAENLALFKAIAPPPPSPNTQPKPAVYAADARAQALIGGDQPWRLADKAVDADFVWDFGSGSVLRRTGDVVARGVTTDAGLRGVVEKWATVEQLRPLLAEGSAKMVVGPQPNGARYGPGATVKLTLASQPHAEPRYATVFDIASDGTVQTLYPLADDGEGRLPAHSDLTVLENEVIAPYGADHVVALVTADRPDAFRNLLRTVDGQRASGRLAGPIKDELARAAGKGALSIGELYTGP